MVTLLDVYCRQVVFNFPVTKLAIWELRHRSMFKWQTKHIQLQNKL